MIKKSNDYQGSLYAILSGFLYGFVGYFGVSAIQEGLSVPTMLFWRFLVSSMVILLCILPQLLRCQDSKLQLLMAFMNGAIFYCVSTMLYFYACHYIGSGLAMVIFFTYPALVMLLNYVIYRDPIPKTYYLAIVIILLGMMLFVDVNELHLDLIGVVLGTVSALFYAAYMVSSKKCTIAPGLSALLVSLGCMTTAFIFSLFNHSFSIPQAGKTWVNLAGIGIIATAVPILLLLRSLQLISSDKASILSVLEPVFVVIFGVLLLGETLKTKHGIGVMIVLSGALLTLFSHRLESKKVPEHPV